LGWGGGGTNRTPGDLGLEARANCGSSVLLRCGALPRALPGACFWLCSKSDGDGRGRGGVATLFCVTPPAVMLPGPPSLEPRAFLLWRAGAHSAPWVTPPPWSGGCIYISSTVHSVHPFLAQGRPPRVTRLALAEIPTVHRPQRAQPGPLFPERPEDADTQEGRRWWLF
jgi:hypothetical protein